MRKLEFWIGTSAGVIGIVLAALSMAMLLPYSADTAKEIIRTYAAVCMAANAAGIVGAVLVRKHHILGSAVMAPALVVGLFFGFPWQSISAVLYIMGIVLAVVPVREEPKIS